ncbi:MAG TPA: ribosome biogenesis GTPase Der, partial [Candidatus Aminicenantes bacterium]|nr:ribosome biogenesis GTPase Der [Candidatus Aminicenantes bacterium]
MTKLPRVVIVGFPNVGKSTLFNRLLGRRKALVHADPGMTRDSLEAECAIGGRRVTLVDTGGLFGVADEPLSERVRAKALEEAAAADLVLFLLDGKRDVAPAEEGLYADLRRGGLALLVVVNKVDSPVQEESRTAEYYRLGEKDIHFVSAEHKLGIGRLEEAVAAALPAGRPGPAPAAAGEPPLRIAVVGRTNVGKSSLVNRLAGAERLIVSELPGTTRDSTDILLVRDGKPFLLVDTAGIRRLAAAEDAREKAAIVRAKANIRRADVVCLVLDVREFPTRQDARVAQLALESGRPLVLALNKWDLVERDKARPDAVRERVFRKLGFVGYAPLLLV